MITLYVSGPRDCENFDDLNLSDTLAAAERLEAAGYDTDTPGLMSPRSFYISRCVGTLLKCHGVAVLPGWEECSIARLEMLVAEESAIPIHGVDWWISLGAARRGDHR